VSGLLLEVIRGAVHSGELLFSLHAIEEMGDEGISLQEISEAVHSSETEVIESRLEDPRGESHLLFGRTGQGRPLHMVFGRVHQRVKLVTTYRPDLHPERWTADFRARRRDR
jgi:hypothetical protein